MNIQKNSIIFFIVISFLAAICLYSYSEGEKHANADWVKRIAEAPIERDTIVRKELVTIPAKIETVHVYHKAIVKTDETAKQRIVELVNNTDAMIAELQRLSQPVYATCQDTNGTVEFEYAPLDGNLICHFFPAPREVQMVTVTETKTVIQPRPWYELPAAILCGAAAMWLIESELKHE